MLRERSEELERHDAKAWFRGTLSVGSHATYGMERRNCPPSHRPVVLLRVPLQPYPELVGVSHTVHAVPFSTVPLSAAVLHVPFTHWQDGKREEGGKRVKEQDSGGGK